MSSAPMVAPEQRAMLKIQAFFDARKNAISSVIQGDLTPQRMFAVALSAMRKNPELLKCSPESLYLCIHQGAQLGLEVGSPLGHAYFVPFKDEATFIAGYRGLVYLAHRSGAVLTCDAHVVYQRDVFEIEYGSNMRLVHRPATSGNPGEPIGAYAIAKLPKGGEAFLYMRKEEIEEVRAASRSKNSPMWTTWWAEAWRKTVIRRFLKHLPLDHRSDEQQRFAAALDAEEEVIDVKVSSVTAATPAAPAPAASRVEALAAELGASGGDEVSFVDAPAQEAAPTEAPDVDPAVAMPVLQAMLNGNGTPESKALAAEVQRLSKAAILAAGVQKAKELSREQLSRLYADACAARDRILTPAAAGGAA